MKKLLTALAFASFTLSAIGAKAEVKVGFVDLQKAIESTSTGKKAKGDLEKEFNAKKKDLEKKEADLKEMSEDIEKKKTMLSEEVRNRRQAEFQQEVMKFRQVVSESEVNIRKREQELTQPIVEKLQKAIAEIAKAENFTVVLHQSDKFQTILWADQSIDLTDRVVKQFEK